MYYRWLLCSLYSKEWSSTFNMFFWRSEVYALKLVFSFRHYMGSRYWTQAMGLVQGVLYWLSHSAAPWLLILYLLSAGVTPCAPLSGIGDWTQGFLQARQDYTSWATSPSFYVLFEPDPYLEALIGMLLMAAFLQSFVGCDYKVEPPYSIFFFFFYILRWDLSL